MAGVRSSVVAAGTAAALVLALAAAAPAAVIREGDLDPAFDVDGVAVTEFGTDTSESFEDVAVQADGKAVAVGTTNFDTANVLAVARYRTDGSLDSTFGGDGRVTTTVLGRSDVAQAVAIQADGKIVVAGYAQKADATYDEPLLLRYNTNGSLDTTFNGDGKYFADWGNDFPLKDVVIQPDGRIVAVGALQTGPTTYQFGVLRFTARGSFDSSFSGDGKITASIAGDDSEAISVALQPDGKIVAGGYGQNGPTYVMALARFNSNGGFDSTFSGDGKQTTQIGDNAGIEGIALAPDGRIAAVGIGSNGTNVPAVTRYLPNGLLDPAFGDNGVLAPASPDITNLKSVLVQPNGRLLVAGTSSSTSPEEMAVARLNVDSTLDPTFGDAGLVTIPAGTVQASARALARQRDGKIFVAGYGETTDFDGAVARLFGDRTAPFDGHVIGLSRWSTSLRPSIYWQASDDNTGIKSFDVRQRVAKATAASYGSYTTIRSATSLTAGTLKGATGRTTCVSARGRDWAGNVGAYGAESCVAFPVDDTALTKAGSWTGLTGKAYYTGTARRSSDKGATLTLAGADYRHLALVATTCSGCGTVKVYLGKTLLATVKLTSGKTRNRVVIPIDASLTRLSGTVRVKVATAGKPVVIDGLGISLA